MKSIFFITLTIALIAQTLAQVSRNGRCPNITASENYDEKDFRGRWYEWAKTPRITEPFTRCVFFEYSSVHDGKFMIDTVQRSPLTGLLIKDTSTITPTKPGEWKTFFGFNYNIFATDNSRFAVVYACSDGLLSSSEIILILTRDQFPDYATVFEAQYYVYFELERYSLDNIKLTNQKDCPEHEEDLLNFG